MQKFDHEKLTVYQSAVTFVAWATNLLEEVPQKPAVFSQLDRAATSIALNMAEGNGKHTSADRCRYFDVVRGSALECAACLDVLVAKRIVNPERVSEGKQLLLEVVRMLVGLIRSNSAIRDV